MDEDMREETPAADEEYDDDVLNKVRVVCDLTSPLPVTPPREMRPSPLPQTSHTSPHCFTEFTS